MTHEVETYFAEGLWRNRIGGRHEAPGGFETAGQAAEQGRMIAMDHGIVHVIRDEDGSLRARHVYPPRMDRQAGRPPEPAEHAE